MRKIVAFLFLVPMLLNFKSRAQTSDDFSSLWVGTMKVNGALQYKISVRFFNPQKKIISGELSVNKSDPAESLILNKTIVFDYDKQKNMAYANLSLPAGDGNMCTGWLTLRMNKRFPDSLDVNFRTNKECMKSEIVMGKFVQRAEDFFDGGNWAGYITVDGKPEYKISVLVGKNNNSRLEAAIYYFLFSAPDSTIRYEKVKALADIRDTTLTFDLPIPAPGRSNECSAKISVRRKDLTTMEIISSYLPITDCGANATVFLNDRNFMNSDSIYTRQPAKNSPPAVADIKDSGSQKPIPVGANEEELVGTALLFKDIRDKISSTDQLKIFSELKLSVSKDKKQFVQKGFEKNPFGASAEAVDLNGDGTKEVIINWGNYLTSGQAGQELVIFGKTNNQDYRKIMETSGAIASAIPDVHYGYPDLSIAGPGMTVPVWRFNGSTYQYLKAVSDAQYKNLHPVKLDDFEKSRSIYLKGKEADGAPSLLSLNMTPPTAAAKHYIYQRWKTSDMIGESRENFLRMQARNELTELEFSNDGKVYFYKNGVLDRVLTFVVAPDGKSILLTKQGEANALPMKILSLKATEMIVTSPLYDNDTVIFRTK